ncbi:MAG: GGDEF domain-containing protein [Lachnospiraceae bacterium]|nr:GGDEF domain-containing protein [Lachnospiraceae bacterium]
MKRKNIAVIMTAIDSDGQVEILKGIETCGKANGCNVAAFVWFTGVFEKERHNLGEVNMVVLPDLNLFDGVILLADIFHMEENKKRIESILEHVTCPIVTIGCRYKSAPAVWADNYEGMHCLMEYLVKERGLRRLHFVRGIEGNVDAEARYKAYLDVLAENDIPIEKERVSQGDFYVVGGEKAAREILSSSLPFPEAIVCANDTMAITIYDILTKKGYRVPEDVVITGYDYSTECRFHYPDIISVKIQGRKLGEQACTALLTQIVGKKAEPDYRIPDEVMLSQVLHKSAYGEKKETFVVQNSMISDTIRRGMIHHIITLEKNLMETTGFESWRSAVKAFVEQIELEEFYCCVNKGFVENIFENATVEQEMMSVEECLAYSEEVDVPIAYKGGRFVEKASFASKYAFDELFADSEAGKLYIFSPLHYLHRNFGYFVFVDSTFPTANPLYITWLNYMGNAIENIRKQCVLMKAMTQLDEMYVRDSLTGVYNRFGMDRYFAIVKEKCIDTQMYMLLSFADLDGLKKINDVYGHEEGDRIISAIGRILQEEAGDAYVIRYGGDEFVVMGCAYSEKEADAYWARVQRRIDSYNAEYPGKAVLSISHGSDIIRMDENTFLEDCIQGADQRMYAEKNRKKEGRK